MLIHMNYQHSHHMVKTVLNTTVVKITMIICHRGKYNKLLIHMNYQMSMLLFKLLKYYGCQNHLHCHM